MLTLIKKLNQYIKENKPLVFSLTFAVLYTSVTFAAPYLSSDAILNPTCAPGDVDCYVSLYPDQTGNSGKFLTTNGTSTSWDTITTTQAIGDSITNATEGSILFAGSGGTFAQDNSNFFWDDANNRLGVGTSSPAGRLHVEAGNTSIASGGSGQILIGKDSNNANYSGLYFQGISVSDMFFGRAASSDDLIISQAGTGSPAELVRFKQNGNVGIGTDSPGYKLTVNGDASFNNVMVGLGSGSVYTNTVVGYQALISNVNGDKNTAVGYQALVSNTGSENTAVGYLSLYRNTTGGSNNAVGLEAMYNNATGSNNNAIGRYALYNNISGSSNNAQGSTALYGLTSGLGNVAIGSDSMRRAISGDVNVAIGYSALFGAPNATGSYNIGIGYAALESYSSGAHNIAIGLTAGDNVTTSSNNVMIGNYSGRGNTTGGDNTTIGHKAGYYNNGSGSIPYANNIFIGYQSADNIASGANNNIVIGYDIDLPTNNGSNQLSIGNLIYGTGMTSTGTTVSTGKVGIGTSSPTRKLDVNGDVRIGDWLYVDRVGGALTSYLGIKIRGASEYSNFGNPLGDGAIEIVASGTAGILMGTQDVKPIVFGTSNTERLRIDSSGYVGIGTTSPTAYLDVAAATTSASSLRIRGGTDPSAPNSGDFWFNGTNLNFYDGATTTDLLAGGGMSIGGSITSATAGSILFAGTSGVLTQDNTNLFFDDSNNRLGIGTASPAFPLDVGGKIGINGTQMIYYPGGNLTNSLVIGNGGNNLSYVSGNNGKDNTLVGIDAGVSLSTGYRNTALGNQAMYNATGDQSVAVGYKALYTGTGSYNTAVGYSTLVASTSGRYNTAIGYNALIANQGGSDNTSIGAASLRDNVSGNKNVAIGEVALLLATGSNNIAIGYGAGLNLTTGSNNIMIGYAINGQTASASNQLSIGNLIYGTGVDGTGSTMATGKIGIANSAPAYRLHVGTSSDSGIIARFQNSTGTCDINPTTTSLSCSSDINLKKNITTLDGTDFILNIDSEIQYATNLDKLLALNVVTYNWNTEDEGTTKHIGFIAQQVESVYPDLVTTDINTNLKSLNITNLTPYIVKGIQELDKKITSIETLEENSNFINTLRNWLASASNGIESVFARKVRTQNLCVSDEMGNETCITKAQLDAIISGSNNSGGSSNSNPAPQPQPDNNDNPEPDTNINPDTNSNTDTDTTPDSNPDTDTTIEPEPEPQPEPEPEPQPEIVPAPQPESNPQPEVIPGE